MNYRLIVTAIIAFAGYVLGNLIHETYPAISPFSVTAVAYIFYALGLINGTLVGRKV